MTVYTITGTVEFTKVLIPPEGAEGDFTEDIKAQFPALVESVMREYFDRTKCSDIKIFKMEEKIDAAEEDCDACKIEIPEKESTDEE